MQVSHHIFDVPLVIHVHQQQPHHIDEAVACRQVQWGFSTLNECRNTQMTFNYSRNRISCLKVAIFHSKQLAYFSNCVEVVIFIVFARIRTTK